MLEQNGGCELKAPTSDSGLLVNAPATRAWVSGAPAKSGQRPVRAFGLSCCATGQSLRAVVHDTGNKERETVRSLLVERLLVW